MGQRHAVHDQGLACVARPAGHDVPLQGVSRCRNRACARACARDASPRSQHGRGATDQTCALVQGLRLFSYPWAAEADCAAADRLPDAAVRPHVPSERAQAPALRGVAGAAQMIGKLNATLSVLATCLAATAGGVGVARGEGGEGGGRWGEGVGGESGATSNQFNVALINFFDPAGAYIHVHTHTRARTHAHTHTHTCTHTKRGTYEIHQPSKCRACS